MSGQIWIDHVSYEAVLVTPAMAAEWLTLNTRNRRIKPRKVAQFVRAMKDGRWRPPLDCVAFYADGSLANGQHRLKAILETPSVIGQMLLVARGFPFDGLGTIDQGTARSVADALTIDGYACGISRAALARRALAVTRDGWVAGHRRDAPSGLCLSPDEVIAWLAGHEADVTEATRIVGRVREYFDGLVSRASLTLLAWYLIDRGQRASSLERFLLKCQEGTGLQPGDPALAVRKLRDGEVREKGRRARDDTLMLDCLVRAWNAYATDCELRLLKPTTIRPQEPLVEAVAS